MNFTKLVLVVWHCTKFDFKMFVWNHSKDLIKNKREHSKKADFLLSELKTNLNKILNGQTL